MKYILILLFTLLHIFGMHSQSKQKEHPNILWLSCEDMGPILSSYGAKGIDTPNIDRLAKEGVRYTNAYATSGVCAPSRSSIITSMYPARMGSLHM